MSVTIATGDGPTWRDRARLPVLLAWRWMTLPKSGSFTVGEPGVISGLYVRGVVTVTSPGVTLSGCVLTGDVIITRGAECRITGCVIGKRCTVHMPGDPGDLITLADTRDRTVRARGIKTDGAIVWEDR